MKAPPRLSGKVLQSIAKASRTRFVSLPLMGAMRVQTGINKLTGLDSSLRGPFPTSNRAEQARSPREYEDAKLPIPSSPSCGDSRSLQTSFRTGELRPDEWAEACFQRDEKLSTKEMASLLHKNPRAQEDAEASTERWQRREQLSLLDGVPVLIKEQLAVAGLPHQGGSKNVDGTLSEDDSFAVASLRRAGAIILGTTVMTEFGMSPLGQNPDRTMPKNPFNPLYLAGGSSTGCGVGVATGIAPLSIGVDGGGSVRIPAVANGVFGLKPTWGRVSRSGDLLHGTVNHLGPLATSVHDLALGLGVLGGRDSSDAEMHHDWHYGAHEALASLSRGVKGVRIGVPEVEWSDCSKETLGPCEEALRVLEKEGAILVPIQTTLARLATEIGSVTLGVEAQTGLELAVRRAGKRVSSELEILFNVIRHIPAPEFADAQMLRSGLRIEMKKIFQNVDLIAYPGLASRLPKATRKEMSEGFSDLGATFRACRYMFMANLTGLPAGVAPVGFCSEGLPIGFQLYGDAFDEASILSGLAHLERVGFARVERPGVLATL